MTKRETAAVAGVRAEAMARVSRSGYALPLFTLFTDTRDGADTFHVQLYAELSHALLAEQLTEIANRIREGGKLHIHQPEE